MRAENTRTYVASVFVAAAALWPTALCAVTYAMATPLQRALQTSWCGAGPQSLEVLGHCPACWSGATAFLLGAAFALAAPSPRRLHAEA
jgi:hypothetical protein